MEILISANEQILSMVQNPMLNIAEKMTEEQLLHWVQAMERGEKNNERDL